LSRLAEFPGAADWQNARLRRRHLAENAEFGQRIRAEPVGTVDADAGTFTGGIEARQRRRAETVDEDAAHGVMHRRADRYRRARRIDAEKLLGQFVDLRQALAQLGFAEMAQVEMHHRTVLPLDGATLLLLVPEGLAEAVARPEFHRLVARRRLGRPETIVLQIAIAVLVDQEAALATTCFGKQQAGARHAGRVVLDEFHVPQGHAVAVGQSHAVAGHHAAVGVLAEDPPGTAGGDDHRSGLDQGEFTGTDLDRDDALDATVLDHQINAEMLVETLDRRILDRRLEQRVQHVETGLVGGEPGALDLHAAERRAH
jgi:hypothetical protein